MSKQSDTAKNKLNFNFTRRSAGSLVESVYFTVHIECFLKHDECYSLIVQSSNRTVGPGVQ
jgi:hypothetical protein